MKQETYETLKSLGFIFLNYPVIDPSQTEPTRIKLKHPVYDTIITVYKVEPIENYMKAILSSIVQVGYDKGFKRGRDDFKQQFRTMLDI